MLALTTYKKIHADPVRSERSRRAAYTRLRREELRSALWHAALKRLQPGQDMEELITEIAVERGGVFTELIGTKWVRAPKNG